jgi:hypothetical protein
MFLDIAAIRARQGGAFPEIDDVLRPVVEFAEFLVKADKIADASSAQ